jgi:hypothetical protein
MIAELGQVKVETKFPDAPPAPIDDVKLGTRNFT